MTSCSVERERERERERASHLSLRHASQSFKDRVSLRERDGERGGKEREREFVFISLLELNGLSRSVSPP